MKKRPAVVLGGLLIAVSGAAAFATVSLRTQGVSAVGDPRQEAPIVRLATAVRVRGSERSFTGIIGARVQSNLGFRVAGKIVERLVNVGQQVKAGQPLMRIDETDLRLALTAKRNAVAAARASFVQLERFGCIQRGLRLLVTLSGDPSFVDQVGVSPFIRLQLNEGRTCCGNGVALRRER